MKKLLFVLLAFFAIFTLIRSIENAQAEESESVPIEARIDIFR